MGKCMSKENTKSSTTATTHSEKKSEPQTNNATSTSNNNSNSTSTPAKPDNGHSAAKPEPAANTIEASYDIGEEIGRGAFSIVKRAKNRKTGEMVAIKFIEKKYVEQQDLMLLAREIDIMKKVQHDNVLRLLEVFETDDMIALVMELVLGGELFYKIVEKGSYSEQDAANIIRQVTEGVAYLHQQGICHRDLKPENLLCGGEEDDNLKPFRVVIADFGLSKAFDSGESLETSCGTPDYVAPEVITAEGSYDKSVDMWSCGVITYVLLCGFSPFLSNTQTGLFEKIIKCDYDFPDPEWTNISEEAKDFIRHLLVKDPAQRYTAEQCKQHPWLNGSHGGATSLAAGGEKMKTYNQQRETTKQNNPNNKS